MNQISKTHYVTKVLIDIMFYGGIVCVLAVPWAVNFLNQWLYHGGHPWFQTVMVPVLVSSGIFAVAILFYLKKMFRTMLNGNPFVWENVSCFRKIAVCCACIAVIYLVKSFLLFSPATIVIVLMFSIGMLFCLTLKDLFKQAITYKEENELTI